MAQRDPGPPGSNGRRNDGSRKREKGAEQQPQEKRRKVTAGDDGDWDDIEFTQDDLATIDVIASQAANEPPRPGAHPRQADREQTLPLEGDLPTMTHGHRSQFQVPGPSGAYQLKTKSSSTSDSSFYPGSSSTWR